MSETPLYTALMEHRALHRAAFHTPGHKNNPAALPDDLLTLDFTELPDTDSLLRPKGPFCARSRLHRGSLVQSALFSAGGVPFVFRPCCAWPRPNGGRSQCGRVVHRSAVNAMALLGLEPVWALPEELADAAALHPDARAVYVTSPNYYRGVDRHPPRFPRRAGQGIPLLVDNAHGAHLFFTGRPASNCAGGLH